MAPTVPAKSRASGEVLIDGCQAAACQRDECARLENEVPKLAVEWRSQCPIDREACDHDASEKTGEQLSDVHDGHDQQVEGTGTSSKCLETEKHDGVEKATAETGDEKGYAEVDAHLLADPR